MKRKYYLWCIWLRNHLTIFKYIVGYAYRLQKFCVEIIILNFWMVPPHFTGTVRITYSLKMLQFNGEVVMVFKNGGEWVYGRYLTESKNITSIYSKLLFLLEIGYRKDSIEAKWQHWKNGGRCRAWTCDPILMGMCSPTELIALNFRQIILPLHYHHVHYRNSPIKL